MSKMDHNTWTSHSKQFKYIGIAVFTFTYWMAHCDKQLQTKDQWEMVEHGCVFTGIAFCIDSCKHVGDILEVSSPTSWCSVPIFLQHGFVSIMLKSESTNMQGGYKDLYEFYHHLEVVKDKVWEKQSLLSIYGDISGDISLLVGKLGSMLWRHASSGEILWKISFIQF